MIDEPSVLDYIKARLFHRVHLPLDLAEQNAGKPDSAREEALEVEEPSAEAQPTVRALASRERWPWLMTIALFLALFGQYSLAPREGTERSWALGSAALVGATGLAVLSVAIGEWTSSRRPDIPEKVDPPTIAPLGIGLGLLLSAFSFLLFRAENQQFSAVNLIPLTGSLGLVIYSLWVSQPGISAWKKVLGAAAVPRRLYFSLEWPRGAVKILAAAAAIALTLFFRLYRLGEIPPEMNSDHAEKLLDILRVLNGEWLVFFPSNGGREALIFYLGAALHHYFGLPLDFMLLKIGSALIGLAALPFLFALGNEIGGRRVGWIALTLAGVAYWPNVVSRFGLRLPFYFFFTAALMYFLVRGLRRGQRNDFIYAGIALGLGLYGYTPNRLLFLPVILAIGLFLLHARGRDKRVFGLIGLLTITLIAFVLFIPLLSYILAEPQAFLQRTLTRMAGAERPLEDPALLILTRNFGRALAMFSWDNGEIWPVSIPGYPALNVVSGALFYLGSAAVLARYLIKRNWVDLFLLLSIPLLLLPSTLALAFPAENPNLYRTGGAMIPVFLLAAIALDGLARRVQAALAPPAARWAAGTIMVVLIGLAALQDYSLVFDKFYENYRMSAWNSSEMGTLAREFSETIGSPETIWVIGYPHWVDSRLVAANAGFTGRDFRIDIDQLESTRADPHAKLFILHKDDLAAVEALKRVYPLGWVSLIPSKVPTKEFQVFFAPPDN